MIPIPEIDTIITETEISARAEEIKKLFKPGNGLLGKAERKTRK